MSSEHTTPSETRDQVNPLSDLLEDQRKIKIEIAPSKNEPIRGSLEWMKDALDNCSSRSSKEDVMSEDSTKQHHFKSYQDENSPPIEQVHLPDFGKIVIGDAYDNQAGS